MINDTTKIKNKLDTEKAEIKQTTLDDKLATLTNIIEKLVLAVEQRQKNRYSYLPLEEQPREYEITKSAFIQTSIVRNKDNTKDILVKFTVPAQNVKNTEKWTYLYVRNPDTKVLKEFAENVYERELYLKRCRNGDNKQDNKTGMEKNNTQ